MLNSNDIGADAMIHTRDHQTPYLFDPWDYLGPKRKMLLSESWAGLFREHILPDLPVHKLARFFPTSTVWIQEQNDINQLKNLGALHLGLLNKKSG
jgi:hypothetical protein